MSKSHLSSKTERQSLEDFSRWLVDNNLEPRKDSFDTFIDRNYYPGIFVSAHEVVARYLKQRRLKEERDE